MGLLTSDPAHPLLAGAARVWEAAGDTVVALDPGAGAASGPATRPGVDLCLLKARTPEALALARAWEAAGVPVVNGAGATELVQDRVAMARVAREAGLPFAAVRAYPDPGAAARAETARGSGPLVVKSRFSRRGDLVARVESGAGLAALARGAWRAEPVVVQEFAGGDGFDHKLWSIGGRLFAAVRRSELSPGGRDAGRVVDPAGLPAAWARWVARAGTAFGLSVFGVDLIDPGDGREPVLVDVNAFPGVRGQAGAPEALVDLVARVRSSASGGTGPRAGAGGREGAEPVTR
ncbi:ATP-grasp domain-containing protein [Streptomyces sp. BI20]|uniref:ATP-grasp domain-containing protein n=1 Tax=Streptomyces sp. BI20 TaxID=3403460 RepID=UPI003C73E364